MLHTITLRKIALIGLVLVFNYLSLTTNQASVSSGGVDVWTSIGGPGGGSINALAVDPMTPTTLYAGTNGNGMYKSTNGGENWRPITQFSKSSFTIGE